MHRHDDADGVHILIPYAKIYNLDDDSRVVGSWTQLKSVRLMFDLFMKHKKEFE